MTGVQTCALPISTANISIAQPTPLTGNASTTPVLCFGGSTGTVTITASGGTTPYSGTNTYSGLAAGSYTYTVSDANGCTTSVTATISQPTPVAASSVSGSILCNGGTTSVTVSAAGGIAPYSGLGSFTVAAGTYSYTVTDANGCTTQTSVTVAEPAPLTANAATIASTCSAANGSFTVSAFGGTAPYNYSLNGGTTQSSPSFSNLLAGGYSVTITDINGCSLTIPVSISNQLAPVINNITTNDVLCFGGNTGALSVSASGGSGTLLYSLNGSVGQIPSIYNGLTAGTYSVSVTDANGCLAVASAVISEPTLLVASATSSPEIGRAHV